MINYWYRDWHDDRHEEQKRLTHKSERESTIYNKLKEGPKFDKIIEGVIPRNSYLDKIKVLITPSKEPSLYPLIIGEHRTRKTSLIQLAIDGLKEPKGIVYINIDKQSTSFAKAMQQALEWYPDPVIDSTTKGNLSSPICGSNV